MDATSTGAERPRSRIFGSWFSRVMLALVAAVVIVYFIDRSRPAAPTLQTIAAASGASSCDTTGYYIKSRFDGGKQSIYNCWFGSTIKCVTYSGGIANDETDVVRLLFANTLSAGRPACVE
jgi:hypothetical protein